METTEQLFNEKEIENDFLAGLKTSELKNDGSQVFVNASDSVKSRLVLPDTAIKLVCNIKNGIATKFITKDMDEDDKEFIRDFLKTSTREIELYKRVLEDTGSEYTSEEFKALVNKYLNSPMVLIIEFELERMLTMKAMFKNFQKTKEKKAA